MFIDLTIYNLNNKDSCLAVYHSGELDSGNCMPSPTLDGCRFQTHQFCRYLSRISMLGHLPCVSLENGTQFYD